MDTNNARRRGNMYKNRLKQAMDMRGISAAMLASKIGSERTNIYKYLRGDTTPKIEINQKIAAALRVDARWLAGEDVPIFPREGNASRRLVPVLGYVAAGIPIEAISEVIDYEELSADMVKDGAEYFALKIKGDSMAPRINTGDVVIVRKQEDVDSGQLAIVCINGDLATCKRIIKHEGGIMLQPLNQSYQPVFYSSSQIEDLPVTILGRVVELRAKF